MLKGKFKIYTSRVRPVKARWIDLKVRAMDHLIEEFELYFVLLNNISSTTNSKEKATSEGKFIKLLHAKVHLSCALFTDILAEVKKFSLISQKSDINIIYILDSFEST